MKVFTFFALVGLLGSVCALPQETTAPVSQANQCATDCGSDICCTAKCFKVPCPSENMVNQTTQCAMDCPQGSGTPDDAINYADCQTKCINAFFLEGTTVIPNPTKTGEATGTGSPTGDSTSSPSPSAGGAAINAQLGSSAAGIVGILMAALAL
ncbi:hypothetical protein, variant 2 [Blastomyces dermatitidis ER-3]|uniref:Uncharacterized protein n=1 Tax=Ajellomyces dermatitidis (strain ER-3 / ATCC MYA-2586) TaxID=559297 RepID=A0ABX2VRQ5_AJEDR|nr:uncharacterized protein BDCG_01544 [Blastomyces dermatitidis ER-3]XP_045279635.1 hypothetical protein, variant 1 [Blastomyces dermatitidis ER-3]XP_045279636.1 hypothetical protein, variant 2 [Blastomyces dermatitidis ER-3]EEQ86424.1 hypothetical protein BDCG_01544 [Blastomyces dermatitidis ER-3]OAS99907.1 hypothetical protein, variant 1 [Blastomyces dermatitidis ER-3]OAS99908.1 hypothetical protein, variant 2 [Blastomyces dermatitidis ER-3]